MNYIKLGLIIGLCGLVFSTALTPAHTQADDPLLTLLASAASEPAFPQMAANTVSYADYRAIEQASGVASPRNRAAFEALSPAEQAAWEAALLRIYGGPANWPNLTREKIAEMPELVGFDFFDVDQALRYGADPFVATLFHSADGALSSVATGQALRARGYQPQIVPTGLAWGRGGDGMTDINQIQNGDPFGGDVGLASRVAVLDSQMVGNAFIWSILARVAQAHAGEVPSYADLPEYQAMSTALQAGDGALLQAFILNELAGEAQTAPAELDAPGLPPYVLAATADLQADTQSIHRVIVLYADASAAEQAAAQLPALISAFDNDWLDTLGFDAQPPSTRSYGSYTAVTYDLLGPPTTQDTSDYGPSLIFGFWANAIRQGRFSPFALPPS